MKKITFILVLIISILISFGVSYATGEIFRAVTFDSIKGFNYDIGMTLTSHGSGTVIFSSTADCNCQPVRYEINQCSSHWLGDVGYCSISFYVDGVFVSTKNTGVYDSKSVFDTSLSKGLHTIKFQFDNFGSCYAFNRIEEYRAVPGLTSPVVSSSSTVKSISLAWTSVVDAVSYKL